MSVMRTRRIALTGKLAVGANAYTTVDDEDFPVLSKHKWKAKPNTSGNIYAIRTTQVNGKTVDIRMHREVMRLKKDDPRDIDHRNHNSLDNRKQNLRICTRKENLANMQRVVVMGHCLNCGQYYERETVRGAKIKLCKPKCKKPKGLLIGSCLMCNKTFLAKYNTKRYCSMKCRFKYNHILRTQGSSTANKCDRDERRKRAVS